MIVLVMALVAEVKPVRNFLHMLRKPEHKAFPWYEEKDLVLIQSGPGKSAAATAATYAAEQLPIVTGFVNFGICGHGYLDIGTLLQVQKIVDQSSGRYWDLVLSPRLPIETTRLLTVESAQQEYPENSAVDMEAAGFYDAARRFVEPRQIACLKVVSDNPTQHWKNINKKIMTELITNHLNSLQKVLAQIRSSCEHSG